VTAALKADLFSDTQTRPSTEMRAAMAKAEVGDEQLGEDPSVNELQEMVAALLGKEAALFLPSGTMCNQISFSVHCRRGDEILMHRSAHPLNFEAGGPAALAGALVTPLDGARGIYSADELRAAIRFQDRHSPRTSVASIEQTTNMGGGACWPLETIHEVCEVAEDNGLNKHLDGARLMNAVVATGVTASEYAAPFDSVWLDLSKGLGCPVGAVLAGGRDFIDEAWHFKQLFGGAMRQAGIVAAAGSYALRHNVARLAEDHANARLLAEGLAEIAGIDLDTGAVETNIVFFEVDDAPAFNQRMTGEHGVRFSELGDRLLRAVTHLDVDRAGIEHTLAAAHTVLAR
jgi:threonine aldolase